MSESEPNADPRSADPAPRRRRYPWVLAAIALFLVGLVAAAPSIVSTNWARGVLLDSYNDGIPGTVTVESLSLSWLGGQSVRGLRISDSAGEQILALSEMSTELSLIEALQSKLSLGRTLVRGLDVHLELAADGSNNLSRALGAAAGEAEAEDAGPVVPVTGNMLLADSRVAVTAPGIQPVQLEELEGALSMQERDGPIELELSGVTRQGELEGSIALEGTVKDLFRQGELTPAAARMEVDGRIQELPVDALDQLTGAGGLLAAALGDRANLAVQASGGADNQEITLDASAPNGELTLEGVVADGRFRLRNPASARLRVTPALMDAVNARSSAEPAFRLAGPVPLQMDVERLEVPLAPFSLPDVAVTGALRAAEPVRLSGIRELGAATLNELGLRIASPALGQALDVSLSGQPVTGGSSGQLALDARVQHLFDNTGALSPSKLAVTGESTLTGVPTGLLDTLARLDGRLAEALGPDIDLALDAQTDAGGIKAGLQVTAERLQTETLQFSVGEDLTLARPARIRMTVTPALWRQLAGETAAYQLVEPAPLTLDVTNLSLALPGGEQPGFSPGAIQLQATLAAKSVALKAADGGATRIRGLTLDLGGRTLADLDLDASGEVTQPEGVLASMDASPLRIKLDTGTGLKPDFSLKAVTGRLVLDSAGLKTNAAFSVEEGLKRLALSEPAAIEARLAPALLAALQDPAAPAVSLQRPAAVEADIQSLDVPLAPFDFAGMQAEGSARIAALSLQSAGDITTRIADSQLGFSFAGADRGRAELDFNARVQPEQGEPGDLSLNATAGELLDGEGRLSAGGLSLVLDGKLQHLPVALVDQLMNLGGMAVATLGAKADFDLKVQLEQMRGPVTVSLASPTTTADIQAQLTDAGLTLEQPLVAQVQPTPAFGSQVLASVHPIFETLQRSEQPIRFEMPPEGVAIPVQGFDISKVAVPRMTMDFGKLVLKSGWLLKGVIGLGQQFGKLDSVQPEELEAWFTPGVLALEDGQLQYKRRLDLLLARKLHLATWGRADLARDQSNLILALMPDTLERVFGITVAGDDALHIPIEGSLASPSINYRKAGSDLARLRAQEEVSGESALAGALLGAVTGGSSGEAGGGAGGLPPASVTPLPWAGQLEPLDAAATPETETQPGSAQQQQAAPQEPKKQPSTEEKVIKGLMDMFGNKKEE